GAARARVSIRQSSPSPSADFATTLGGRARRVLVNEKTKGGSADAVVAGREGEGDARRGDAAADAGGGEVFHAAGDARGAAQVALALSELRQRGRGDADVDPRAAGGG